MRQAMVLAVLGLGCLVTVPAAATAPWWFSVGPNFSRVDGSEGNCGGGQGAFTFGAKLLLRLQFSQVTFEDEDHSDGSCDVAYWGDSFVEEPALLIGLMNRSGAFVALGPARVDFGERDVFDDPDTPRGLDTGIRFQVGWSSRRQSFAPVGIEVMAFQTTNDIQNYAGVGLNVTFGPRRARINAPRRPGR